MIALWHLSRPKLLPFVLLLVLCGYGFGHWDRALTDQGGWRIFAVLVAWTALHAGTLWLNAAVDRDEGEVLYGKVVPPPAYTAAAGYAALALCVAVGASQGLAIGVVAAACALLAALYSHPSTFWKGHPVGGPFVNVVGYGLLSPLAGFLVVGVPPTERAAAVWVLGGVGVLGQFFAAQAFQRDEDAARGYRTLVVTHGPQACVDAARWATLAGMVGGIVLAAVGWVPRVCLVALPVAYWVDSHYRAWRRLPDGGGERQARELARRLLAGALLAIGLCFADYFYAMALGQPVAGLGTAAGHPADRPLLPPAAMRQWERANGGVLWRGPR